MMARPREQKNFKPGEDDHRTLLDPRVTLRSQVNRITDSPKLLVSLCAPEQNLRKGLLLEYDKKQKSAHHQNHLYLRGAGRLLAQHCTSGRVCADREPGSKGDV